MEVVMDEKTAGSGAPPAQHGVPLDVWGVVLAGLGDGFPLEELLAHVGVDERRWVLADTAFNEALVDDVEAGGTLAEALDEAMREARKRWTRAIPPLDLELRAWLDFYRAWVDAEAPLEYLRARGLRATDIHRIQAHWRARLAEEPALRAEALSILEAPPGPVPEPRPKRARLLAAPVEEDCVERTDARVRRPSRDALPFEEGEAAPAHPRLSVPLPPSQAPPGRGSVELTRAAVRVPGLDAVLPFASPRDAGDLPAANRDEPSPDVATSRTWEEGDGPEHFGIERYAALCVDATEAGVGHHELLRKYGLTAARKLALDTYWTQKMAEDPAVWLAWDRACAARRSTEGTSART
jgi:hypothetical protein